MDGVFYGNYRRTDTGDAVDCDCFDSRQRTRFVQRSNVVRIQNRVHDDIGTEHSHFIWSSPVDSQTGSSFSLDATFGCRFGNV